MNWKIFIDRVFNRLTLDTVRMSRDILYLQKVFRSVDELQKPSQKKWDACFRMLNNFLNTYPTVSEADRDVKAAYLNLLIQSILDLKHGKSQSKKLNLQNI